MKTLTTILILIAVQVSAQTRPDDKLVNRIGEMYLQEMIYSGKVLALKDSILHIELDIELDPVTPDTTRINIDSVKWSDFGIRVYGDVMNMEEFKSELRKRTKENRQKFESENYDYQYYLQKGTNDWKRFKEAIKYRTDLDAGAN